MTCAISSTVTSGSGNGSYYLKVDSNAAVSGTDFLFDTSTVFLLGSYTSGESTFRGKIFDVQIQNSMLSDAQITTLHTNLKTKYGF